MKANEFRIGNYIQIEEVSEEKESGEKYIIRDYEVIEVDSEIIRNFEENDNFLIYKYSPIPLTEEWLFKFGFVKQLHEYIKGDYCLSLIYDTTSWLLAEFDYNTDAFVYIGTNLDYVHQLQNLYFALTGEELIINHC
jgi:hypothetical protein